MLSDRLAVAVWGGAMKKVTIKLSREEALAAVIALSAVKKPYSWQQDALAKINKALGRETR